MLPCESNFAKSVTQLVHELEINHERVNSSAEGARKLFLENERLKVEQKRQAELYVLALRERAEAVDKLKELEKWKSLAADWRARFATVQRKYDQAIDHRAVLYNLVQRRATKAELISAIVPPPQFTEGTDV